MLSSVTLLPDPCPLPEKLKKRSLNEREKLIYAPMTGVGGIVYDKVLVNYGNNWHCVMFRHFCPRMQYTLIWKEATPMRVLMSWSHH